jgi:hypothetical protein
MNFPPHLLDELARIYAHAAVDALLEEPSGENTDAPQSKNSDSPVGEGGQNAQDAIG